VRSSDSHRCQRAPQYIRLRQYTAQWRFDTVSYSLWHDRTIPPTRPVAKARDVPFGEALGAAGALVGFGAAAAAAFDFGLRTRGDWPEIIIHTARRGGAAGTTCVLTRLQCFGFRCVRNGASARCNVAYDELNVALAGC
jgi:hypothetical protein